MYTLKIFDLPVKFIYAGENQQIIKSIEQQFGKYPSTGEKPEITIELLPADFPESLQCNPSMHHLIKDGFSITYPKYKIAYYSENDGLVIKIRLKSEGNRMMRYLKKLNNIQYNSIEERIPQIIWENCLYPSMYFNPNYTLIHSSGFSVNNKEALLLGGTGGVGKTSLELSLSENKKFGFLNDDIAVVDRKGSVYPNLSWPKIYAYNLVENQKIQGLILKNRSVDDRMAFKFKKLLWGKAGARRIINPEDLFSAVPDIPLPLKKFIFLSRGNYPSLSLEKIESDHIADLNISIIQSEFVDFENHLNWHYYNAHLAGVSPLIRSKMVHDSWKVLQEGIFKEVDCYIMKIPSNIEHRYFIDHAAALLDGLYS